jgi:hypothetical protein
VFRIVLPLVACISAAGWLIRHAIATINVGVAIKVVVDVDVDVVVSPAATPAPATTPCRSHSNTNTERDRHPCGVISSRWIVDRRVGIHWGTVYHDRVVSRNVDYFGTGLLDHNHLLAFDYLGFDFLLLAGL